MIPNWAYATMTDKPGIPKELLRPAFIIQERFNAPFPYLFGIKWYRQIKGHLRQFGFVTNLDHKRSSSVIEFVKKRWLEDIDTYDRIYDRWSWIPFIGWRLVKYFTRDLFKFPSI